MDVLDESIRRRLGNVAVRDLSRAILVTINFFRSQDLRDDDITLSFEMIDLFRVEATQFLFSMASTSDSILGEDGRIEVDADRAF
jgi:hypothetical protein